MSATTTTQEQLPNEEKEQGLYMFEPTGSVDTFDDWVIAIMESGDLEHDSFTREEAIEMFYDNKDLVEVEENIEGTEGFDPECGEYR